MSEFYIIPQTIELARYEGLSGGHAPFGSAPFDALDDGAGLVQGPPLQISIRLHAVEQDGISLPWLGRECIPRAFAEALNAKAGPSLVRLLPCLFLAD